jgi:LuxR family maltose regulon positive regulatory protein
MPDDRLGSVLPAHGRGPSDRRKWPQEIVRDDGVSSPPAEAPGRDGTSRDEQPSSGSDRLTAKIALPHLPPGIVTRARLFDELDRAASCRVTLVCAGPGWGKTMLVAGWAHELAAREPVAWVTLDADDNDPVLFWSYILMAVAGAAGELSAALRDLVVRPPVGRETLRRILVGLTALPNPLTLVLDDFGEIRNREVLDAVGDLLRQPSSVRLVLVTRSDPSLHLHRLRVSGELGELRAADLAFTPTEAAQLLHAAGVHPPAEQQAQLLKRTEGWAAGLRLAVLAADTRSGGRQLADAEALQGVVAEYLFEEVLAALSDEQRRFLLCTSVSDKLSGDLADALTGTSGGQQTLESLERANAFVVALGSGRRWFRYHALMAALLRQRLLLDSPAAFADLHERSARWYAAHGDPLAAVRHAVRGRRWQLVGELMVTVAATRALLGERKAFAALLAEIPASELSTSAELRVCGAMLRFLHQDYAGFAVHVAQARAMLDRLDPDASHTVDVFLVVADMVIARLRGDMAGLHGATERILGWLSEPGPRSRAARQYEAPALSNKGVALVWTGHEEEALPYLRAAIDVATATRAELTVLNSWGHLGLLEIGRGHLGAAADAAEKGLQLAERHGSTELAQSISVFVTLAEVSFERNDLEAAQRFLDRGLAAQRNDPEWTPYVALQALRARLLLAAGKVGLAEEVTNALVAELADRAAPVRLTQRVASVAAEIEITRARPSAALESLGELFPRVDSDGQHLDLWIARAELAMGDFSSAQERVAAACASSRNPLVATGAWLVSSLVAHHERDDHRALSAMRRALAFAEPEEIRRQFVGLDDARVATIVGHLVGLGEGGRFTAAVLSQLDPSPRTRRVPSPLASPLTDREMVVLSHMAQLQTNEEIAAGLYVSVNTIKAHARSVYGKLGVSSRREAVHRARELGLI